MSEFPKQDRFSHKVSSYERPTNRYRCGRGGLWGKPCMQGPDAAGKCGGMAECRPFKNGDRWECRRPGGSCESGPLPDGRCCNTQPACSPKPSLRLQRGRFALIAFILSLGVLALAAVSNEQTLTANNDSVGNGDNPTGSVAALFSPGALSDIHLAFAGADGCNECHVASDTHQSSLALSTLSNHKELAEGCIGCHAFEGAHDAPHNQADFGQDLQCQSCHTEHKGRFANLTEISNQQCASCHEQSFDSFQSHTAFGDRFPHRSGGGIVFDHAKHMNFHFEKADDPADVPTTCTSCHVTEGAKRKVKIGGYQENCAGCHNDNIVASGKADLALLELPKLRLSKEEEIASYEACGAVPGERFRAGGRGRSTPFQDWLVGARPKDAENYAGVFCELLQDFNSDNLGGLFAAVKEKTEHADEALFAGLSAETFAQLASTWIENERYRPIKTKLSDSVSESGWYVDSKGILNYRATIHGDPTAIAWLNFAARLQKQYADSDTEEAELAARFSESVLAEDGGLGACIKCHVVDTKGESDMDARLWSSQTLRPHHRFKFNHSAHLDFVGAGSAALDAAGSGCAVCHEINAESAYADNVRSLDATQYSSNFNAIGNETCTQCHNSGSIKDDCTVCHQYHEAPSLTQRMTAISGENQDVKEVTEAP